MADWDTVVDDLFAAYGENERDWGKLRQLRNEDADAHNSLESIRQELLTVRAELEEVRRHARALEAGLRLAVEEMDKECRERSPRCAYQYLAGYLQPALRWLHDLGGEE